MLVARITCHFPPRPRQWASFTVKTSEPFERFSVPVGSLLSVIGLQPWPLGGAQDSTPASDPTWSPAPDPPPEPGPHHPAATPNPTSTISAAATPAGISQRRRGRAGTAVWPRSDRSRPST